MYGNFQNPEILAKAMAARTEPATCPECGYETVKGGLGAHRRKHGVVGQSGSAKWRRKRKARWLAAEVPDPQEYMPPTPEEVPNVDAEVSPNQRIHCGWCHKRLAMKTLSAHVRKNCPACRILRRDYDYDADYLLRMAIDHVHTGVTLSFVDAVNRVTLNALLESEQHPDATRYPEVVDAETSIDMGFGRSHEPVYVVQPDVLMPVTDNLRYPSTQEVLEFVLSGRRIPVRLLSDISVWVKETDSLLDLLNSQE